MSKALAGVYGVDVNPYAVSIARVRITLAAVERLGVSRIGDVPRLELNVVVADSLLHGFAGGQGDFGDLGGQSAGGWKGEQFSLVDEVAAKAVLGREYAVVVGNPPYITVKDAALRDAYRGRYRSAFREYSLAAPFMERFFGLGRKGAFVGQITANSFMKREFGKKLIEEVLPEIDLTLIVNTAGAYIPGHGTPTVLIFGRSRRPEAAMVSAVLARRGEPRTPEDAAEGLVWRSIRDHWDEAGFENEFVTIDRVDRTKLARHPWSLEGGGAAELKALLEARAETTLGALVESIGFMCITKQDDAFSHPVGVLERAGVEQDWIRHFVIGEHVRDWSIASDVDVLFPYDASGKLRAMPSDSRAHRFLWPLRTILEGRAVFGGKTFREAKRTWFEYGQIPASRVSGPCITFAFVATHNHFVLDRGGKVFKQTAPIIKLPATATEDDHLALLAYLNSSTAAFWFRQVLANRGYGADASNARTMSAPWDDFYEFAGGLIEKLPIPKPDPAFARFGALLDRLALARAEAGCCSLETEISQMEQAEQEHLSRMVGVQEELDWYIYAALALLPEEELATHTALCRAAYPILYRFVERGGPIAIADVPPLSPTERGFETTLAASDDPLARLWTASRLGDSLPFSLTDEARALRDFRCTVARRRSLGTLESPEFKRPWRLNSMASRHASRVRDAELATVERRLRSSETPLPIAFLLTNARALTSADLAKESVPFLAALRFSPSGLEIHGKWQACWAEQKRSDAASAIAPPPRYSSADYSDPAFWRLRGKLDVPRERFISYPGCASSEDDTPIYGWAGWDHAQRARALAGLYVARKESEGWSPDRLVSMLVGVAELLPWLQQWHSAMDPAYGQGLDTFFDDWLSEECRALGMPRSQLAEWRRPPCTAVARKSRRAEDAPTNRAGGHVVQGCGSFGDTTFIT